MRGEHRRPRTRLTERPTGELLVLAITFTVCFAVVAGGAALTFSEIINPEHDMGPYLTRLSEVLNTLIGLLAGFVAGRTDLRKRQQQQQNGSAEQEAGGDDSW